MEQIFKDLECVEVTYSDNKKKVTLTFYDPETGEIREINFNKQSYADGQWIDDREKAAKVEQQIADDLGLTFDTLGQALGTKHDVYAYPKFSSLHHVDVVEKFTSDMSGMIYQTEIKEIIEDNVAIRIRYDIEGKTYESKMTHGKYLQDLGVWAKDPVKKANVYAKFADKFLVPVEEKDSLIGHPIMVEVKMAFGKAAYGEIKKFPKKK